MENKQAKHPASLGIFFATEMWERYGFYVVQTLLALYLLVYFKWQDKEVYALVGTFTGLSYFAPLFGGWIADRLLGQKITTLLGTFFLFFSYIVLAYSSSETFLFPGLAGIIVGTGLLKPNISSLLGNEYAANSPVRDSGFTIFYMGITLGILLGTLIPSPLKDHFGWSAPFASAALGIALSTIIFIRGINRYNITDYLPYFPRTKQFASAFFLIFLLWITVLFVLFNPIISNVVFIFILGFTAFYFFISIRKESFKYAQKMKSIGLLFIISTLFWTFYFQMFLSLIVLISRLAEPKLFGFTFPPPYYVTIESMGVLIFGYILSRKKWLNIKKIENVGNKFILAMIFLTIAFGLVPLISQANSSGQMIFPLSLFAIYLIISLADILLSPTALAAITWLSNDKKVSTMVGLFFVSLGIGSFLAGKLANLTSIHSDNYTLLELKSHYTNAFTHLFIILLLFTLFSFILNRFIRMLLKESGNPSQS